MKQKALLLSILVLASTALVRAQYFESAHQAVANMRLGWNLGNTLDSNSGDLNNMWIEQWTPGTPSDYETAWGQPITTPELIQMFAEAGFGAIRVPVTWYPHITDDGNIDEAWLCRVHEVVDYVIDAGMYCVLNVHHDTGAANTHWLIASTADYQKVQKKYENLWQNIAREFKDYDHHLLFEAYNEMLDKYDSWCFATFAAPGYYNAADAADAYTAINSYAQSFVNAVRETGGNNSQRNLIVNTYAASSGDGTWNVHLSDPVTQFQCPYDAAGPGHLITEVHVYPPLNDNVSTTIADVRATFERLKTLPAQPYELDEGQLPIVPPVIIGEWGTSDGDDIKKRPEKVAEFSGEFVKLAKEYGYATFMWMMLSDGADRSVPRWTAPAVKDAMVKGYYGEGGFTNNITDVYRSPRHTTYDLAGRKSEGIQRGLIIKDGKKYISR